ncbi:MAG TPA: DUF309 domain-containing protein, partial [Desulfopila sp.]|nr:DUF309 domain-containing protein [Desulfopila sp.]
MISSPPPFNIAHRGARSLAPENTMIAFRKALEVGAHGIESDVRVSADGRLILHHDLTFERTTDVARMFPQRRSQPVHTFDWLEISRLNAGSWFAESDPFATIATAEVSPSEVAAFYGSAIPLLEEALVFVREHDLFFNIEIKPQPAAVAAFDLAAQVIEQVERARLDNDRFSISSFDHQYLRRVKELRADIEVNALIGENLARPQDWGGYEFAVYNANFDLIDILQLEEAWRHGCRVNLYTVNQLAHMQHYLGIGVEKVITDYPQLLSGHAPAADGSRLQSGRFQPFADRLSRDIRNHLSKAFALSLAEGSQTPFRKVAKEYLACTLEPCYHDYVNNRLKRYSRVFNHMQTLQADTLRLALMLWDEKLFFEVHEVLEPVWLQAEGSTKLFLQAMIRA